MPANELAPHPPLKQFYSDPSTRPEYIQTLFNKSAPFYDWSSSVLSFGTDKRYRRTALHQAGLRPGMRLLDVASGTGLVVQAALELGLPPGDIIGLDPSIGMLQQNRPKHSAALLQSFGEHLPVKDISIDFISMGYALRHVASLPQLFAEFLRVLRPGGRILVLEISRPESRLGTKLLRFYMHNILPKVARLKTGNADLGKLLEYYWATIEQCVPPATIVSALADAGFQNVQRKKLGPILNDYTGAKAS